LELTLGGGLALAAHSQSCWTSCPDLIRASIPLGLSKLKRYWIAGPSQQGRIGGLTVLKRALDVLDLEALDDVADPHVLIVLEGHAAFLASNHLAHFVLETLQGGKLAFVHHDVVADQPHLGAALDLALGDAAASHLAHLGDGEQFEDFGIAEEILAHRRRKEARHGLAHFVDEVVDDRIVADLDAVTL